MVWDNRVSIRSHTFIQILLDDSTELTFSDYYKDYEIDTINFTGLGKLMSLTNQPSEIRATGQEISITVSGIPNASLQDVLANNYRGSEVVIYNGIFDHQTGELLVDTEVENPVQIFRGIVTNWGLSEDFDNPSLSSSNTIIFTVASEVNLLSNKVNGRRTNPVDHRRYFPNDPSMDRVPNLMRTNFNFGAPQ